jgi:hypothetical protein
MLTPATSSEGRRRMNADKARAEARLFGNRLTARAATLEIVAAEHRKDGRDYEAGAILGGAVALRELAHELDRWADRRPRAGRWA